MRTLAKNMPFSLPGICLDDFKCVIDKIVEVTDAVGPGHFYSPYSVVPVISQLIGLESPMMGSGRSPYSLMSFSSKLKKKDLFMSEFEWPVQKKRMLIDEVYGMIAPLLLDEEDAYADLLLRTVYGEDMHEVGVERESAARNMLLAKFHVLKPLVKKLLGRKGDFAHIAHYGYMEDLLREQSFLKDFSASTAREWLQGSFPVVVELEIIGFAAKKEKIAGWFIFIPNTTEELLRDEDLRKKKLLQCGRLAKILGAGIVGMAGLTASFSRGGQYLARRVEGMGFTTGHAYTIANIVRIAEEMTAAVGLELRECVTAVIGAAGSIGSGVSKMLAGKGVADLILIDREGLTTSRKLDNLEAYVKDIDPGVRVRTMTDLSAVRSADVVIIATSAAEALIGPESFMPGAIIIDDSFPKNVSKSTVEERDDIILLEGGITQLPGSLDINMSRNIPDFLDVPIIRFISTKQTYGCFAETVVLSLLGHTDNYGLGDADPALAGDIMKKADSMGFSLATFQCYGQPVSGERIQKVRDIVGKRAG